MQSLAVYVQAYLAFWGLPSTQYDWLRKYGHLLLFMGDYGQYRTRGRKMSIDIYDGINVEALRKLGVSEEEILVIAGMDTLLDNELDRLIACVEEGGLSIDAIHHKSGNNLMMEAAGYGAQSIVRYLIRNGADVNYHNPINGNTALHMALGRRRLHCLKYLLDGGADRHAPNHAGMTLMDCCKHPDFQGVQKLITQFNRLETFIQDWHSSLPEKELVDAISANDMQRLSELATKSDTPAMPWIERQPGALRIAEIEAEIEADTPGAIRKDFIWMNAMSRARKAHPLLFRTPFHIALLARQIDVACWMLRDTIATLGHSENARQIFLVSLNPHAINRRENHIELSLANESLSLDEPDRNVDLPSWMIQAIRVRRLSSEHAVHVLECLAETGLSPSHLNLETALDEARTLPGSANADSLAKHLESSLAKADEFAAIVKQLRNKERVAALPEYIAELSRYASPSVSLAALVQCEGQPQLARLIYENSCFRHVPPVRFGQWLFERLGHLPDSLDWDPAVQASREFIALVWQLSQGEIAWTEDFPTRIARLLERGAFPPMSEDLSLYAFVEHPEILDRLLRAGADPNRVDVRGQTFLMRHAHELPLECLRVLVRHGAHIVLPFGFLGEWRYTDGQQQCPLHRVIDQGDLEMVQIIIEESPGPVPLQYESAEAKPGENTVVGGPLHLAERLGRVEIAAYLETLGAKRETMDELRLSRFS